MGAMAASPPAPADSTASHRTTDEIDKPFFAFREELKRAPAGGSDNDRQGAKGSDGTKVRTRVGTLRFASRAHHNAYNPMRATHRRQRSSDRADRPDT